MITVKLTEAQLRALLRTAVGERESLTPLDWESGMADDLEAAVKVLREALA
jgi:hypothetical protein